jgi:hypothetical protein
MEKILDRPKFMFLSTHIMKFTDGLAVDSIDGISSSTLEAAFLGYHAYYEPTDYSSLPRC